MGTIEDKTIIKFIRAVAEGNELMTEEAYKEIVQEFLDAGKEQLAYYLMALTHSCATFDITD